MSFFLDIVVMSEIAYFVIESRRMNFRDANHLNLIHSEKEGKYLRKLFDFVYHLVTPLIIKL